MRELKFQMRKISKAIEEKKNDSHEKKKVFMWIQFILEIYVYRQNYNKNKTNFPPLTSTPVTVFLVETTKPMILKFSGFLVVLLTILWKIKDNCMSGSFCIANLLEVGRKIFFLVLWLSPPNQIEAKYSHDKF